MTSSLPLILGLSFDVSGALALDLPFCHGTLKLSKYYIQYFEYDVLYTLCA